MFGHREFCQRCGEELDPTKAVWLELNSNTGIYHDDQFPKDGDSQGGFAFGSTCAKKVVNKVVHGSDGYDWVT